MLIFSHFSHILFLYCERVCVCDHFRATPYMWNSEGQLIGVGSLVLPGVFWAPDQVTRLGGKHLHFLSHLARPVFCFVFLNPFTCIHSYLGVCKNNDVIRSVLILLPVRFFIVVSPNLSTGCPLTWPPWISLPLPCTSCFLCSRRTWVLESFLFLCFLSKSDVHLFCILF